MAPCFGSGPSSFHDARTQARQPISPPGGLSAIITRSCRGKPAGMTSRLPCRPSPSGQRSCQPARCARASCVSRSRGAADPHGAVEPIAEGPMPLSCLARGRMNQTHDLRPARGRQGELRVVIEKRYAVNSPGSSCVPQAGLLPTHVQSYAPVASTTGGPGRVNTIPRHR